MTQDVPGVVGWFYGIHTAPGVNAYKLGPEIYQKLRDLGCNPDLIGTEVNKGKNLPEITDEQRMMVYNAERECYKKYKFDAPF